MSFSIHILRIGILAYFAALFALALWVAWSIVAAAAANPDCAIRHCKRYEVMGDWMAALQGDVLLAASMSFTGVVVGGVILFALPWWLWLQHLKRKGVVK